jgi:UDP-N-acetylmuramoyl-L-alanyl-D-glutamate--2,6-diaminopimelate ligase
MKLENILDLGRKIIPTPLFRLGQPVYHYLLAVTGNLRYGFPGRKLIVIGITGTNGKSTTAELVNAVLKVNGKKTGMLSSVAFEVAGKREENTTSRTTLGRWQLQKKLSEMVEAGCTHAVIEVSSEALSWHRLWGIPFDIAVFTNLTPEHLNFHKNMESYRNAKGKLFANLNHSMHKQAAKSIIVNADDKECGYFYRFEAEKKITFGLNNGEIWATNIYFDDKTTFQLVDGDERFEVESTLPAKFNIYNMLAAYAVGKALNYKSSKIVKGIESVKTVEGRMQEIPNSLGFKVFIDYAVTPDAFENLFRELRRITKNRLIAVFGATGDRDKDKRPKLGEVAAKLTDYIILTDEEPYGEKPRKIIEDILPGIQQVKKHGFEIVLDRKEAIEKAIKMAFPNDTIVVTGMGHERYRNIGGNKKIPWNEAQIISDILEELSIKQ